MARPSNRLERDRAVRRADFLRAADRLFGEKGYHETSMEEIADTAEYGTGTIYLYFKSKEALYAALLEQKTRELTGVVSRTGARHREPWDAIRAAVQAQLDYYDQNRAFFQTWVRERLDVKARLRHEEWEPVVAAYDEFLRYLARLVETGQERGVIRAGDSRLFAVALSGLVNQLTRDALRRQRPGGLDGLAEFVADLFQRGAKLEAGG